MTAFPTAFIASALRRIEHGTANPTINDPSRIAAVLNAEFLNSICTPKLPHGKRRPVSMNDTGFLFDLLIRYQLRSPSAYTRRNRWTVRVGDYFGGTSELLDMINTVSDTLFKTCFNRGIAENPTIILPQPSHNRGLCRACSSCKV